MSAPKVVKRYANRKLYDTERSSYVTLEDISLMIKAGEEVQVVDNKSGEDLTAVTFAQIIFESEKKQNAMPLALLRGLIRDGGGAVGEFYRGQVDKVSQKAADIKERAETLRTTIKSELEERVDKVKAVVPRLKAEESEAAAKKGISDLVQTSQKALDDLQKGIEERVKGGVGNLSRYANVGREMDELRKRLAELEERLGKFPQ